MGVTLLLAHLPSSRPWMKRLLRAQGIISGENDDQGLCLAFSTMDEGLMYCEDKMLEVAVRHNLCAPVNNQMSLQDILSNHLLPQDLCTWSLQDAEEKLQSFVEVIHLESGENLFSVGGPSDEVYLLCKGRIVCEVNYLEMTEWSRFIGKVLPRKKLERSIHKHIRYGPGGVLGDMDFVIQRPRSFNAKCETPCILYSISREQQDLMRQYSPYLLNILQTIILRSASLSASHALEALERSNLV
eukprot:TRINITY_DN36467_c1_g2_i1.p1 TRINITY_DN36467_c1_g2~~TRINITY_DN36467_c1_g2_i1.p1  ORF type:complete len:243 (+),score=21.01 TRINITY_DN36467_c1_g2_i1:1-729(+)